LRDDIGRLRIDAHVLQLLVPGGQLSEHLYVQLQQLQR
jgi:hypothetical protein